MKKTPREENITWLQLSDLHILESTDWNMMLDSYCELSKRIHPKFLVITGDYRDKRYKENGNYEKTLDFLDKLINLFGIKRQDVFFVPGNHDVKDYEFRKESIKAILQDIDSNPDAYVPYLHKTNNLKTAFEQYTQFITKFYKDSITDLRISHPADVISLVWRNMLNIVVLNTALISDGSRGHKEIIDIKSLSSIAIDSDLPTIVLGHHDIDSICDTHKDRMLQIFSRLNVKAYLCGDTHKVDIKYIDKYTVPGEQYPCIVCGKSAVETMDNYSDVGVIEYCWKNDGFVYVRPYKWGPRYTFIKSDAFLYDIDKDFRFRMGKSDLESQVLQVENISNDTKKSESASMPVSIWLPDAEYAKGSQARFDSFTKTPQILEFLDDESGLLGIVSVKGIGKTFVLQVKRVSLSKKYKCLPSCRKPSMRNNWATERVAFDTYSRFKTPDIYNDMVILWRVSLMCYVINYEISLQYQEQILSDTSLKIPSEILALFISDHRRTLNSIMNEVLDIPKWHEVIKIYASKIGRICESVLQERKRNGKKKIAIFIDKVDQSIKQTNSEPPADCVLCKKSDFFEQCRSKRKGTRYCTEESGCQSKNCCYGCEIFASSQAESGLRVYENSPVQKIVHINIWQYLQLSLIAAADDIRNRFNGEISVFYTIRQEAFACESDRLGEQNQKIAGLAQRLKYSIKEHHQIFLDCIRFQDPIYLFAPEYQHTTGEEEYAFLGVRKLCHPYCKDEKGENISETVFESIYRHSFDRSRDIQRYGQKLTKELIHIKECVDEHSREEKVKTTIEKYAAKLAYCARDSESTVNPSYYTEKMRYMPNYWADNEHFENLLKLIDRNLLFEDDIREICRKVNGCSVCPKSDCSLCQKHPFSVLLNLGFLGYIRVNNNHSEGDSQYFLDASEITYFHESDQLFLADRVAYIVHPALSKCIERNYHRRFKHFSGFILGKGMKVEKNILTQMLEDRDKLTREAFVQKYYYVL